MHFGLCVLRILPRLPADWALPLLFFAKGRSSNHRLAVYLDTPYTFRSDQKSKLHNICTQSRWSILLCIGLRLPPLLPGLPHTMLWFRCSVHFGLCVLRILPRLPADWALPLLFFAKGRSSNHRLAVYLDTPYTFRSDQKSKL